MVKRIFLLLLTNFLVIATISIALNLIGVRGYITASGLDFESLAIFAAFWGFGGAFISLAISRIMAKWLQGVQVIDPRAPGNLSWLVEMVHDLSRKAKLPKMPQVGIYESPEVNAFATGPTKSRSLVAVSTGLIQQMSRDEIEGVIGHEVAHIQNGDMVTLTLIQGVVNSFTIFFARVIAYAVAQVMSSRDEEGDFSPFIFHLVSFIAEIFLTLLGSMVVRWFSRKREFKADSGSSKLLLGKGKMIAALRSLGDVHQIPTSPQPALAAMKISSGADRGGFSLRSLFLTHPPLEDRIKALEKLPY